MITTVAEVGSAGSDAGEEEVSLETEAVVSWVLPVAGLVAGVATVCTVVTATDEPGTVATTDGCVAQSEMVTKLVTVAGSPPAMTAAETAGMRPVAARAATRRMDLTLIVGCVEVCGGECILVRQANEVCKNA